MNRFLEENYRPVREERTDTDLPVVGAIPDWLAGRYLRNGPNPVVEPDPDSYHWFLGSGMVHGIRLKGGRAEWYRNRWVRSADVAAALGEEPRSGAVHAGLDFAANTHVIAHAGRTYAIVEAGGRPYELTDMLDTIGPSDFDGTLPGGYTAHPLRDPATGELHAVSYYFGWGNRVQYSVLGTDGRIRRTVDIDVGGQPMMHAFSLTDRHVVLYDLPVTFDTEVATRSMPGPLRQVATRIPSRVAIPRPIATWLARRRDPADLPYRWDPDRPARVGLLPRDGGADNVRWFEVEQCYVYHPLNAFDDDDRIVLDVVRHRKVFANERGDPIGDPPTLDRWTVDPAAGKVLEERLDDRGQEFPRIDERLIGRRHRYGYAVGVEPNAAGDADPVGTLYKHDLVSGQSHHRTFGPGCAAGEFVFVPSSADAAEDDGVLMGLVYDAGTDRSSLWLLDAGTLDTIATVGLPVRVPHGFHGSWAPDSAS